MPSYLRGRTPGSHLKAGAQVEAHFQPVRHAVIAADVKRYLGWYAKYAAKQKLVEAAEAKVEALREALAEADSRRDDATVELDLALINEGANKRNSFKEYGGPSPFACLILPVEKQTEVVDAILSTLKRKNRASKRVLAAAKALSSVNAAVRPKIAALKAGLAAANDARADRDALERPLRRQLTILKLRARAAETEGVAGLYAELFAA